MLNHLVIECQRQHAQEVQAQAQAARPAEAVTPEFVVKLLVKDSRAAYEHVIELLQPTLEPLDPAQPEPKVPVEQIAELGFGTAYLKAANDAYQRYGAEGDWDLHQRRAEYRLERFQAAATRGLRS